MLSEIRRIYFILPKYKFLFIKIEDHCEGSARVCSRDCHWLLLPGQARAVQQIITSPTIETISRVIKEITRITLTVLGCYRLSEIRMTVEFR